MATGHVSENALYPLSELIVFFPHERVSIELILKPLLHIVKKKSKCACRSNSDKVHSGINETTTAVERTTPQNSNFMF